MNRSKLSALAALVTLSVAVAAVAQETSGDDAKPEQSTSSEETTPERGDEAESGDSATRGSDGAATDDSDAETEESDGAEIEESDGAETEDSDGAEAEDSDPGETDSDGVASKPRAPKNPAMPEKTVSDEAGAAAWVEVAAVLQSPRCMNCHPNGDRPLQTDASRPHRMNVSRTSEKSGMECATCHREQNSEALGISGGPPGAPNWHLPPEEHPMVFEDRSVAELCVQLKNPNENGGKSMAELLHHVSEDPLVLWGWDPGGDRTKPPLSHDEFVTAFETWVTSQGACPPE